MTFRRVYPDPAPIADIVELVFQSRPTVEAGQWVMINMVASFDGATTVGGRSSPLADDDDRALFRALRAAADVILVGAGTVRAEDYGPVKLPADRIERRRRSGLPDVPRMAVLSRRLDLDPGARLFADQSRRPLILTGDDAEPSRLSALGEVADVVASDGGIEGALANLGGGVVVLCEGGPMVNAELAAAGRIDEVHLTVAPLLTGGMSKRIVEGRQVEPPAEMALDRILSGDRSLFLRYLKPGDR